MTGGQRAAEDASDSGTPATSRRVALAIALLAGVAVGVARWSALGAETFGRINWEEVWNVGQARVLAWAPPTSALRLQYRSFCGGCSAEAVEGAVAFRLLGASVGAWKLGLVVSGAVVVAAITGRLARRVGLVPAAAFATLATLAPASIVAASLRGWGNHVEAAGVALLALVVGGTGRRTRGALASGLLGGLAVWIGLSSAPIVLGAALAVGAGDERPRARLLAAFSAGAVTTLGGAWLALAASTDVTPLTIYGDLVRATEKLPGLSPERVRDALVSSPVDAGAAAMSIAAVALAIAALLRDTSPLVRGSLAAIAAMLLANGALGVGSDGYEPGGTYPLYAVRYLVPAVTTSLLVVALGVGRLHAVGRPRLAAGLLALALPCGIATARDWTIAAPLPRCQLARPALVASAWRRAGLAFRARELRFDCPPDDGPCAQLETYRRGVVLGVTGGALPLGASPWALAGYGLGRVSVADTSSFSAALDPLIADLDHADARTRATVLAEAASHAGLVGRVPDPAWIAALGTADREAIGWGLGSRYPEQPDAAERVAHGDPDVARGHDAGRDALANEVACDVDRPLPVTPGGPVFLGLPPRADAAPSLASAVPDDAAGP